MIVTRPPSGRAAATYPGEILTIEDDTPEDAEPVTGEFVPRTEQLVTHPRLTVSSDGHGVHFAGNVRLSELRG